MNLTSFPRTPRLCNRFSLGLDPEFVFTDKRGRYIYAESVGLTTMQGFGCDMSGRQAEIRAYPSRFALEVVASIVDSLRWMAFVHGKEVLDLNWSAISYNGHDGCGGHIHFGRRRPKRERDLEILDKTTRSLLNSGLLNKSTFQDRLRVKKYGKWSDARLKPHGYEYRTPPTTLANPWLCYFTLVVHKLALYHGISKTCSFKELFEHYQDVDDDAAIALQALNLFGGPVDSPADFKPHWGVCDEPWLKVERDFSGIFFPSSIPPEEETCHELFALLTRGVSLPKRVARPTWEPYGLPPKFSKIHVQRHTLGHLPDVGMDLVSKKAPVNLELSDCFTIASGIPLPTREIKAALSSSVAEIRFQTLPAEDVIYIQIPRAFNESLEHCKLLHEVLSNTELFPVCRAKDLSKVDWSKWDNPAVSRAKPMLGRLLAKVEGKPEPIVPKMQAQYQNGWGEGVPQAPPKRRVRREIE